jgi:hypothetical protein
MVFFLTPSLYMSYKEREAEGREKPGHVDQASR